MPMPRVYVETTIPSVYHTGRDDPEMVRNRLATRRWWASARTACELVTSRAVLNELGRGKSQYVPWRLSLLDGLRLLESNDEVIETAETYIRRKVMPADPLGDAMHLALAAHHKCDLLLTWNYRHLLNANKLDHIQRINGELGLFNPRIVSPLTLLEDDG